MMSDLYAELGVERGATAADVRKAYRKRAKKTHPDAGGSAEDFQKARRAMTVLTDPEKRAKYDATGEVNDEPNNDRSKAVAIIEDFLTKVINDYIGSGFNASLDPRRYDLIKLFSEKISIDIANAEREIVKGEKAVAFFRDMRARLSGGGAADPVGRGLESRIEGGMHGLAAVRKHIELCRMAVEISKTYTFRWGGE